MKHPIRLVGVVSVIALLAGGDLLACGDKFLSAGRGTRYQRPKNSRAASVLIYATPAGRGPDAKVEPVLKREGHRSTTVQSIEQLSAILQGGRFDVVLAARGAAADVQRLLGAAPDAAVLLAFDSPPKERSLLEAIDKAVERRDQIIRKSHARS